MSISTKKTEKRQLFKGSFESSLDGRSGIVLSIKETLERNGINPDMTPDELVLVIDEAVMNAMEHGNKWDPSKIVNVSMLSDFGHVDISIEDQGCGFEFKTHLSDFEKGNKMSSRGRGISIIRRFCAPTWGKSGRRITLHIPVL